MPSQAQRIPGRQGEAGPPDETRAQRVTRWVVLVPASLLAALFTFLTLVNDWFWGDLLIYEGQGSFLDESEMASLASELDVPVPRDLDWALTDFDGLWASVYLVAGPLLALVVLAAVVGPQRFRRRAAVAGAVVGVVTAMALTVGWFDVQEIADQWEGDARELASAAPAGGVTWYTGAEPRIFGFVALLILLVVDAIVLLGPVWSRSQPGPAPGRRLGAP